MGSVIPVWKEVLCLGRQQDRFGRWFTVDGNRIHESLRNANLMLSRGVPIPCVWEHQKFEAKDADDAEKKARYAKFTFAHIGAARTNTRGNLELRHDCTDPADVKQLGKIKYVSPKLCGAGYEDSRGGKYHGTTIAHVAATPTPVQFWQRPFEFSRGETFHLSYTLGDEAMAKEDDDDKGGKKKGDGDEGSGNGELKAVIDALREDGKTIPDEVSDWAGLIIAIKSSRGAKSDDDLGLDDPEDETTAAPGAPMMMSEDRAKPLRKRDQRDASTRIRGLYKSGRITRDVAHKKIKEAETFEFSYTKAGDTNPNKLTAWIEAREELPRHSAWKPKGNAEIDLSETREEKAPVHLTGPGTPDSGSVKEATDFVTSFISDPPKK